MLYTEALRRARDHEQADMIDAVRIGMGAKPDQLQQIVSALRGNQPC